MVINVGSVETSLRIETVHWLLVRWPLWVVLCLVRWPLCVTQSSLSQPVQAVQEVGRMLHARSML